MRPVLVLTACLMFAAGSPTAQEPPSQVRMVDALDARKLQERGDAVIVDVRSTESYSERHIAGAISVPLFMLPNRSLELTTMGQLVILYCACVADASSLKAAHELLAGGARAGTIAVLRGGWTGWNESGLATRTGPLP